MKRPSFTTTPPETHVRNGNGNGKGARSAGDRPDPRNGVVRRNGNAHRRNGNGRRHNGNGHRHNGNGHPDGAVEAIAMEMAAGRRALHRVPKELGAEKAAELRRRALAHITGIELDHTAHYSLDAERAARYNCENFVGVCQVPIGVVGPLPIRGRRDPLFVPLATTEGALLASTNRGCAAIRAAGGATVDVEDVGMTRAPVFRTTGIEHTRRVQAWVDSHFAEMRAVAERDSRYIELLDVRSQAVGSSLFLRFRFSTGDAMGMNMATIAVDRVTTELIQPATGAECVSLSGNYGVDKKPSAVNAREGRGKRIFAEVVLEGDVLERYLKTRAAPLVEVQYRKNLLGSAAAGSLGFNAHYANLAAALFIATGQDPAQVAEAALGTTCIEPRGEDGVYMSICMPDAPVGVVGGGTDLATQHEALALLGALPDPDNPGQGALRLAEALGATVLAGELSLLAALTSHDLARAHERLGRAAAGAEVIE